MRAIGSSFAAALAASAFMVLGIGTAQAGGSISLDEVMEQLKGDPKLITELNAELKAQTLKAEAVICTGARFGSNWTELGGARAIPYDCTIGQRTIHIEGELHLYDEAGKELGMDAEDTPQKAMTYKELHLTWKWS